MNVFLWGFSGSGETAISMETVKVEVSHCKEKNKSVRVIVTTWSGWRYDKQLLTNIREYLKNIDVQILPLEELCADIPKCKWDIDRPKDTINAVIRSLSTDKTSEVTIFVCDEVNLCRPDGQPTPDWTDLATEDNVEWILSMRPDTTCDQTISIKPPTDPERILERKLLHSHRNALLIRSVCIS